MLWSIGNDSDRCCGSSVDVSTLVRDADPTRPGCAAISADAETPLTEAASTPSTAPIELHPASTPSPLFTPTTTNNATGSSWTPAECSWAQSTLTTDAQLDIAGGRNSPDLAAYYAGTAQDWTDAAAAVATVCGDPIQNAPFNLTWMVSGQSLTAQGCSVPK